MIIVVDFDGTIVQHQYPQIGPLIPGAKEALRLLKKKKHEIIIWTCRSGEKEEEVKEFLKKERIPYDGINENKSALNWLEADTRKVYGDVYIDDRGLMELPSWPTIIKMIEKKSSTL